MKLFKAITTLVLLGAFSSAAIAAELLTKEDLNKSPDQYEKIGTIVTSGELAPIDAKAELSKKADELGGDYYVITSTNTNTKIHASADVYKKK
ncbi:MULTISPECIES: DUF1471 family periplasmic protein YahO [Yersinia]|uniref:YdgH/BhsA/McbA-like domain-containing protein n=2 Tax=Yersinia bercovieri TaxID=634 RepID=A0A2G4U0H0_YERBE|nr:MULTISPECIES: DUF1471 family periplasmic protein YahO [Yersinia]EEQ04863.1 hypothetical protein yberc0001_37140 [Yersinia bercovieri ATCC 43970]MCB5300872.1 DUF1471 family periplasmic protein YahO [Yersinia bercovieri]MDN0101995.1 DUF1471 family periplasmic protein YahO [Yersinia bercovieri]PHZ26752.1 hypothetical protein CS533_14265 [Yersinia bercovieri]QDW33413.1 DUF1471 domain-containing protein [Yersinia sp. KBS0713]